MNPKLKATWVAALRSGDYRQGFDANYARINGSSRFCVMGVLNDILGRPADERDLPNGAVFRFVNLNDIERLSFVDLADVIESADWI